MLRRRFIMNGYERINEMKWLAFSCFIVFCVALSNVKGDTGEMVEPTKTEDQLKLEMKEKEEKKAIVRKAVLKISPKDIEKLNLPEDTSQLMTAKEMQITGNTMISTEEILSNIPLVYNASSAPLLEASSADLYDFRTLCDIIDNPGQPRKISARTIRGLTQCILSIYRNKGYSGIFVSVPPEAVSGGQLRDGILLIKVTEAQVASVTASYFTPGNKKVEPEEGYLKESFLKKWTPTKVGEVGKQKELEDYINLLNLNPDRHVTAKVSRGAEPNTLAVGYNVYEANPWHWFAQIDNAGTKDRQYAPRVGLINTNLFGVDDKLTIFHQAKWDKDFFDNYSLYGSYDIPVMGPELRLRAFAAYSKFNVDGGAGIGFLGHGWLYGGELRYNVLQKDDWFLDLRSSLSYEESKVSSSIFSSILGSEVHMLLWGMGVDLYKRTDMTNTTISFDRVQNIGGSGQDAFWDKATLTGARTNAEKDFSIYTTSLNHSRYLDTDKIQRLSGSFQWIIPTERLAPAKMTTFGGMYTVRGYEESGIVADGGILASAQYEFDLVKYDESKDVDKTKTDVKPFVRKLAPLAFFDYGWAKMKDKVPGEENEELYSVGPGGIVELGDHFMGVIYYGFPLKTTSTTDSHSGALNFSLMLRW
jgi:hemolysin activation/secretion protein